MDPAPEDVPEPVIKVQRSRPKQMTINFSDEVSAVPQLQLEVAACLETKIVTTTTTTKRSYPPFLFRNRRSLNPLDSKEYPLAQKPTPPELASFTLEIPDAGEHRVSFDKYEASIENVGLPSSQSPRHSKSKGYFWTPDTQSTEDDSQKATNQTARFYQNDRSPSPISRRRLHRLATETDTPTSLPRKFSSSLKRMNGSPKQLPPSRSKNVAHNQPRHSDAAELTAPDLTDALGLYGSNVATPPVTEADALSYADLTAALSQPPRALRPSRPTFESLADQDASLPSPRLSPTLGAARSPPGRSQEDAGGNSEDRSLATPLTQSGDCPIDSLDLLDDSLASFSSTDSEYSREFGKALQDKTTELLNARAMLECFESMPSEMRTFVMYQMLRRSTRMQLRLVAGVVNRAMNCDFLLQLPTELSFQILGHLDHRDLCRAAQVSKHWRSMIDSNETGWKELLDRDGFVVSQPELDQAIKQGWGWQDPEGAEGCERDLGGTLQPLLNAPESPPPPIEPQVASSRLQNMKRKRGMPYLINDARSKRRASGNDVFRKNGDVYGKKSPRWEGPITAANAAAMAVPDPQLGLQSLRRLHLYKSLYRRKYMIRQSWTSHKVKPSHVAFAAHPRHVITCLQFDEDKIVTGSDDTLIHVYDTKTGELRAKLEGHEGGVWALQYEGSTLVSGSTDRSVRVWDIDKGICTQVFYGHTSTVRCLQILMPSDTGMVQDGRPVMMPPKPLIITGSRDSQVRVWRLPEPGSRRLIPNNYPTHGAECPYFVRVLAGHTLSVRSIAAHGDVLVSGSYDSIVRVWKISTGEPLHVLTGHSQKVYSVVLDTKRNRCVSGSMDSMVKVWDLETGANLMTLEGHVLLVGLLDLRDEWLVSAAADASLRVWDPDNGRCKHTLMAHSGAITCFQHDGRKIISGSEKTVKMWDIHTGDLVQDLLSDLGGVWQVKFDDRRCVAAVQRDNLTYIEILDFGAVRDGKPIEELGKRILLNPEVVERLVEEET